MAEKYLFSATGNWYKANLHSHCTVSDGKLTPEEAKAIYKARGYQIYAYSDHHVCVPHPELKDEGFLPITSIECSIKDFRDPCNEERTTYHLNFFAKNEQAEFPEFPRLELEKRREYSVEIINDLIRRANEAGFLAQYNHPYWSQQTVRDFGPLEGLWGFEVFNGGSQTYKRNGWGDQQFLEMMWEGKYLCPTGSDDNHNAYPFGHPMCDSFHGFTMIRAEKLDYQAVLAAMEQGQLYASNGPLIEELYIKGQEVHIRTSPCCKILLRTQYRGFLSAHANEDTLTEAVFDLSEIKTPPRYLRFEVWDTKNQRAVTRAFFPEEWRE